MKVKFWSGFTAQKQPDSTLQYTENFKISNMYVQ